jgi:hypothetical protein
VDQPSPRCYSHLERLRSYPLVSNALVANNRMSLQRDLTMLVTLSNRLLYRQWGFKHALILPYPHVRSTRVLHQPSIHSATG